MLRVPPMPSVGGSSLRPPPKIRSVFAPPPVQTVNSRETSGSFIWNRAPQKQQREEVYDDAVNTRDIVGRTTEALSERGETLTYLQERLGGVNTILPSHWGINSRVY